LLFNLYHSSSINKSNRFIITQIHNIAVRAVLPVKFNKKTDAPKTTKAKKIPGIFGKSFLDFGAAKNPHKVAAVRVNAIISKYFIAVFPE